jgi:gamma-glutamyltranspeptidase / glutathione hydrolase
MYQGEDSTSRVGPKPVATGGQAACASQHPLVTDAMISVLRDGGNAIDAAIAGSMVQATVQQEMTNHAGTVTLLYWDAATATSYELNSSGAYPPDLRPFKQVPHGRGSYARRLVPESFIPGFMPAMKAMYERFATKSWDYLCQPAIYWATEGHVVGSFDHQLLTDIWPFFSYTPSGRAHFAPAGYMMQAGDRWPKPALAETLRNCAAEGPDYFISGGWAGAFVRRANELGWPITMEHMTAVPLEWRHGTRHNYKDVELIQLSPPQMQAAYCSLVLGILDHLDITSVGHYSESAVALYYMAHALRRAKFEIGYINDPNVFEDPSSIFFDADYHERLAEIIQRSRPKKDLTNHVRLTAGESALLASGDSPSNDSCEISVVDRDGNWIQTMNTLALSGIPGEVVGGVAMAGGHSMTSMAPLQNISGWLSGGGHVRSVLGNTLLLRDGKPFMGIGTPGNVYCTMPQVLSNILDYKMAPPDAEAAPLLNPVSDDYTINVESRLADGVATDLAKMGIRVVPLEEYEWHKGSFETTWVDEQGVRHASSGIRRAGKADAF